MRPESRLARFSHGCRQTLGAMAIVMAVTASPLRADTFPVTGTVQFETGIRKLATITLDRGQVTLVSWGDGTAPQRPLLVDCGGFLNRTCDVYGTHRYSDLGVFQVRISYWTPGLFSAQAVETTTATILPVGDFVLLSIGDSVGSGEGNPVIPRSRVFDDPRTPNQGLWDDPGSNYDYPEGDPEGRPCHRTSGAGPALTARHLRSTNPATDVTFIHVACSGDKVSNVITQLREARRSLERARIRQGGPTDGPPIDVDALLISVGANNVAGGFGTVVSACLGPSDCSEDTTLQTDLTSSFVSLPALYRELANEISTPGQGTRGTVTRIYITEYFDPTRMEDGHFPTVARSVGCTGGLIGPNEWEFLYNEMVVPLNDAVRSAALTHGWRLVDGIEVDFRTHGYCAQPGPFALTGDSWVVKAPESFDEQGDQNGTAHPNALGQDNYKANLLPRIIRSTPPATTASATAAGQPYAFGTWTGHDVQIALATQIPIQQSGLGRTFYSVDAPACAPPLISNCTLYTGTFAVTASGKHVVRFFSENAHGEFESLNTVEVWIDKEPPVMTCSATPSVLWAPNGRMIPVSASVAAVDAVSGPAPFVLKSAGTSEGTAAAQIHGFEVGLPDTDGQLLAQRFGQGPGRQYTLTYESSDALGNTGSCAVVVAVPHDQRKRDR